MKKKDIDEFAPEQDSLIPYSQFMAKYCGDAESVQNIPALECEVDLVGTKEPCKVTIDISPSLQGNIQKINQYTDHNLCFNHNRYSVFNCHHRRGRYEHEY